MTPPPRSTPRQRQVLSRDQIVQAAIELLDTRGDDALTVRALTERLSTGSGAIYHHVGNRDGLMEAATEAAMDQALTADPERPREDWDASRKAGSPASSIRDASLRIFDAIAEHPWLATQLVAQFVRNPWGTVTVEVFERIGRQLDALGVPAARRFDVASTLVHYILGSVSQNVRLAHEAPSAEPARDQFFATTSEAWQSLRPEEYPFMHAIAEQMSGHDDREQFLTGIDIILAGIAAVRRDRP